MSNAKSNPNVKKIASNRLNFWYYLDIGHWAFDIDLTFGIGHWDFYRKED